MRMMKEYVISQVVDLSIQKSANVTCRIATSHDHLSTIFATITTTYFLMSPVVAAKQS